MGPGAKGFVSGYPGLGVLLVLIMVIGTWYYWLSPLERELCRKLWASEARHLWTNVRNFGAWVKRKVAEYRVKKST